MGNITDYNVNDDGSVTHKDGDGSTNSAIYKVNDDGSVTRKDGDGNNNNGNKKPNKTSGGGGNNGCRNIFIFCFLVYIIFSVLSGIVGIGIGIFDRHNANDTTAYANDTTAYAYDTIEYVKDTIVYAGQAAVDRVVPSSTQPKSSLSDQCSRRRMDAAYTAYMLVPDFLSNSDVDDDGWMVYYDDNGSHIHSTVSCYDGSAYQFMSYLTQRMNGTYSAHKENWAVESGIYDNQYYYMKAVKSGDKIYFAAFFVPEDDKTNGKLYTSLTKKIFNSSNFPLW